MKYSGIRKPLIIAVFRKCSNEKEHEMGGKGNFELKKLNKYLTVCPAIVLTLSAVFIRQDYMLISRSTRHPRRCVKNMKNCWKRKRRTMTA